MHGVDGYKYVFKKEAAPTGWKSNAENAVSGFTVGLWKDRLRRMEVVFGALPKLTAYADALQGIQNKRNRIAHEFGAERSRNAPWAPIAHVSVGAKDCEKAIRAVSAFIAEADTNLFGPLVGAHEVLALYHDWARKRDDLGRLRVENRRAEVFSVEIGKLYGAGIGREFSKSVIDYYDSM